MTFALYSDYTALIAGFDAGYYTLPQAVGRGRRGLDAITAALTAIPSAPDPAHLADDIGRRLAPRAVADGALPDLELGQIHDAEQAHRRQRFEVIVLETMLERASLRFRDVVAGLADEIVVDHLRPAHEQVLDAIRRVAPKLTGMPIAGDLGARAWIDADATQRAAYRTLDEVVPRLAGIRAAHTAMLGRARQSGRYAWLRNIDDIWPNGRTAAPWPEDPRERAMWMVTSEAQPWLPTAGEEAEVARAAEAEQRMKRPPLVHAGGTRVAPSPRQISSRPDISSRRIGGPGPLHIRIPSE